MVALQRLLKNKIRIINYNRKGRINMNSEVRKIAIESRNQIGKEERAIKEESIFNQVINSEEYKNCDVVFVYVARTGEVDTTKIIENAIATDKCVCVPKVISDGYMEFYEINSMSGQDGAADANTIAAVEAIIAKTTATTDAEKDTLIKFVTDYKNFAN